MHFADYECRKNTPVMLAGYRFYSNYRVSVNGGVLNVYKEKGRASRVEGEVFLRVKGASESFIGWTCFVGDAKLGACQKGDFVAVRVDVSDAPGDCLDEVVWNTVELAAWWLGKMAAEVERPEGWDVVDYYMSETRDCREDWLYGTIEAKNESGVLKAELRDAYACLPVGEEEVRREKERHRECKWGERMYFVVGIEVDGEAHELLMEENKEGRGMCSNMLLDGKFRARKYDEALAAIMRAEGAPTDDLDVVFASCTILLRKAVDSLAASIRNGKSQVVYIDDYASLPI